MHSTLLISKAYHGQSSSLQELPVRKAGIYDMELEKNRLLKTQYNMIVSQKYKQYHRINSLTAKFQTDADQISKENTELRLILEDAKKANIKGTLQEEAKKRQEAQQHLMELGDQYRSVSKVKKANEANFLEKLGNMRQDQSVLQKKLSVIQIKLLEEKLVSMRLEEEKKVYKKTEKPKIKHDSQELQKVNEELRQRLGAAAMRFQQSWLDQIERMTKENQELKEKNKLLYLLTGTSRKRSSPRTKKIKKKKIRGSQSERKNRSSKSPQRSTSTNRNSISSSSRTPQHKSNFSGTNISPIQFKLHKL